MGLKPPSISTRSGGTPPQLAPTPTINPSQPARANLATTGGQTQNSVTTGGKFSVEITTALDSEQAGQGANTQLSQATVQPTTGSAGTNQSNVPNKLTLPPNISPTLPSSNQPQPIPLDQITNQVPGLNANGTPGDPHAFTNINDFYQAARLAFTGYSGANKGTPADDKTGKVLVYQIKDQNGNPTFDAHGQPRYAIVTTGTEWHNFNNSNVAANWGAAGSGADTDNEQVVTKAIQDAVARGEIPPNASVDLIGHSLAGITNNNISARHDGKIPLGGQYAGQNLTINNVLSFGAPRPAISSDNVNYIQVNSPSDPVGNLAVGDITPGYKPALHEQRITATVPADYKNTGGHGGYIETDPSKNSLIGQQLPSQLQYANLQLTGAYTSPAQGWNGPVNPGVQKVGDAAIQQIEQRFNVHMSDATKQELIHSLDVIWTDDLKGDQVVKAFTPFVNDVKQVGQNANLLGQNLAKFGSQAGQAITDAGKGVNSAVSTVTDAGKAAFHGGSALVQSGQVASDILNPFQWGNVVQDAQKVKASLDQAGQDLRQSGQNLSNTLNNFGQAGQSVVNAGKSLFHAGQNGAQVVQGLFNAPGDLFRAIKSPVVQDDIHKLGKVIEGELPTIKNIAGTWLDDKIGPRPTDLLKTVGYGALSAVDFTKAHVDAAKGVVNGGKVLTDLTNPVGIFSLPHDAQNFVSSWKQAGQDIANTGQNIYKAGSSLFHSVFGR